MRASAKVRNAWRSGVLALDYGRFDFGYNGSGPPKLFEFNCDTPTSMLETAIVQWYWKEVNTVKLKKGKKTL